jgi:hypothetical protein
VKRSGVRGTGALRPFGIVGEKEIFTAATAVVCETFAIYDIDFRVFAHAGRSPFWGSMRVSHWFPHIDSAKRKPNESGPAALCRILD